MSLRSNRLSTLVLGVTLFFGLAGGCVERRMTITTDPPNALVYLNGEEVGRTPIERDFVWYGNYDVTVRKDGYQTLKTTHNVSSPWWQCPPIDLMAELMPWHPTDRQAMQFSLKPENAVDTPPEQLINRAGELRQQLENTRITTTQPAVK